MKTKCPLLAQSGHSWLHRTLSAFGGKADVEPLLTNLDLWAHDLPPPGGGPKLFCTHEKRQRRAGLLLLNVQISQMAAPLGLLSYFELSMCERLQARSVRFGFSLFGPFAPKRGFRDVGLNCQSV